MRRRPRRPGTPGTGSSSATATARPAAVTVAVALVLGLLAGCGGPRGGPVDASGGALAGVADLRGASFTVGGGETAELHVLCQLTIAAVQAAGGTAGDQCGRIGAVDVRRSAEQTDVDTGWSYAGRVDRDLDDRPDPPLAFDELARSDRERRVTWLTPTGAGDLDAVVAPPGSPLRTVSGLPRDAVLCAPPEAVDDPLRVPALRAGYGLTGPVRALDTGAVAAGVATGQCPAGVLPGTAGRIPALGLAVLDDDRGALGRGPAGRGGATVVVRTEVLAAHPAFATVMDAVTRRLDDAVLRSLDEQVDQQGRDAREVARRWLLTEGLIARG